MMNQQDNTNTELDKKVWTSPSFQIISFKNTEGGKHESSYEDVQYFNPLS
jgi:hypothetical protein